MENHSTASSKVPQHHSVNKNDSEMNGEELTAGCLLEKLKEQQEIISMMQIQLDLQNERLASHEKLIKDLSDTVKRLELRGNDKVPSSSSSAPKEDTVKNDWTAESGNGLSVADMVKQAAEETLCQTSQPNYVYDETSGLYYDKNSGYYYDPAQELFYNGHTRTYYKYEAATQAYVFHSQLPDTDATSSRKKKRKTKKSKEEDRPQAHSSPKPLTSDNNNSPCSPKRTESCDEEPAEPEEGELPDTPDESDESDSDDTLSETDTVVSHATSTDSEQREKSIPCIRAIVVESSIPSLPKGFLFLVTCMGGSIGREGNMHSILIPDPTVSKHHADIHYSSEEVKYFLTDFGSQSGTFLNGKRLSDLKVKSEAQEVLHGSTLKIGETTLLLHIHAGTLTCGHCEPGLTITKEPIYGLPMSKKKKEELRKQKLKKLRQKYGVEQHATDGLSKLPDSYKDRAAQRRVLKGSDNPFEKTQVASIDESIKEDNKGFKMMAKMGWSSGTSLGRSIPNPQSSSSSSGILEPIKIEIRANRVGLGCQEIGTMSPTASATQPRHKGSKGNKQDRVQIAEKTLKRFKDCDEKVKVMKVEEDSGKG